LAGVSCFPIGQERTTLWTECFLGQTGQQQKGIKGV
jgi:hypothetical protein